MNCYDCTGDGRTTPAVAICTSCGAASAATTPAWKSRTTPRRPPPATPATTALAR